MIREHVDDQSSSVKNHSCKIIKFIIGLLCFSLGSYIVLHYMFPWLTSDNSESEDDTIDLYNSAIDCIVSTCTKLFPNGYKLNYTQDQIIILIKYIIKNLSETCKVVPTKQFNETSLLETGAQKTYSFDSYKCVFAQFPGK